MPQPRFDRRTMIVGGLVGSATAAGVAGCTAAPDDRGAKKPTQAAASPRVADPVALQDWEVVRSQFALDPDLAHLSAFVLASHPAPVAAAIARWRDALDTDTSAALREDQQREDEVRAAASRYLGADPSEVALTDSTTMGLGLTYAGLGLGRGDHVLTTTHDFYSHHEAQRLAALRSGAQVERVSLYDDPAAATPATMVDRIRRAVRPSTRVVAVTWVHSSTGVKVPVAEIAQVVRAANRGRPGAERALLVVDAVHALGVEPETPAELGCDVLVSGTHKWLFGPRGTGIVWAGAAAARRLSEVIPPFHAPNIGGWISGQPQPSIFGLSSTPGGYHSFEHRWALREAFELHLDIGKDRVAERTRELATRLKAGLADLPHVRLVTPPDVEASSGIVCCEVDGPALPDLVEGLRRDHGVVASATPYRESYLRFGPSIATSPGQVDRAVEALAVLG